MAPAAVVVFAMGGRGHVQRLRPLVTALVERGVATHVFTERQFAAEVAGDGGTFVDLYGGRPLEAVDAESRPMPLRYVSFAGHYAADLRAQVAAIGPALVVADSFALIGRVVADQLGLPYVNVCSGHNVDPERFVAQLEADERVHVAPGCRSAVAILRDCYGLEDASPFSYVRGISRDLNIYCEPPAWLGDEERRVFEPVAFFGSLPSPDEMDARVCAPSRRWFGAAAGTKLYLSFGTVVWWSTPADPRFSTAADALAAVQAVAATVSGRTDVELLVSLGGHDLPAVARDALGAPNVAVETYVDQWEVLAEADVFMTHHGLNSTHESIANRVPMLSYPFIWDQPGLADTCQRLGVALPVGPALRARLDEQRVNEVLDEFHRRRDDMATAVEAARRWELEVIQARPAVVDRVVALMG